MGGPNRPAHPHDRPVPARSSVGTVRSVRWRVRDGERPNPSLSAGSFSLFFLSISHEVYETQVLSTIASLRRPPLHGLLLSAHAYVTVLARAAMSSPMRSGGADFRQDAAC